MSKTIDCRGLACPKPVIMTKKELDSMDSGEIITIVDNEAAKQNVLKLAESSGCSANAEEKDRLFYITINKAEGACEAQEKSERPCILVASDMMGTGDDKLGAALMKSYMFALSEADVIPETMLFLNGGVKLTAEGSEVLESLNKLKDKGVEIMSCGTCLDFYGLKEKLAIGTITNMYTIVEKTNSAANTIRI